MSYGSTPDLDPLAFGTDPRDNDWGVHLTGDFYREPENVTRGVTIAPAEIPQPDSFKGLVDGDFFLESGLGLHRHPADLGFPGNYGFEPPPLSSAGLSKAKPLRDDIPARFAKADIPPDAPTDSYFSLETTTLHVTSNTPSEIGNHLLDFLSAQVTSSISKVSIKKFAVKADVFIDDVMCTMKVRVYHTQSGTYAIEFQRRNGDGITFNGAYKQACKYLKPRLFCGDNAQEANAAKSDYHGQTTSDAICAEGQTGAEKSLLSQAFSNLTLQPPPLAPDDGQAPDIMPLLDLATREGQAALQAEAASSFAKMAQEPGPARRALCSANGFGALAKLLDSGETEVAFPTARTLLMLAHDQEAEHLFVEQQLLKKMLGKVRCSETPAFVRQQLSQAVGAVVPRCAPCLDHGDRGTLEAELARAMEAAECKQVYGSLQQAQLAL